MTQSLKTRINLNPRDRRRRRVRGRIAGTARRPRLSVFRSNRGLYVQLVDDAARQTLFGLSDKKIKITKKGRRKVLLADALGREVAKLALAKKIKEAVFDRNGYRYGGRVRALAEGARAGGLIF